MQLVESREEILHLKSKVQQLQTGNNKDNKRSSITGTAATSATISESNYSSSNNNLNNSSIDSTNELGSKEAFKQLSSKIIELENKLAIATRKEVCI